MSGYRFKLGIQLKPKGLEGYINRVGLDILLAWRVFFRGGTFFRGNKRLYVLRVPVLLGLSSNFS